MKIKAPKNFKKRLRKLGAKKIRTIKEKNVVYNAKFRDFKKSRELVRIREEDGKIILTYKRTMKRIGLRKNIEINTFVGNQIYKILESIGLYPDIGYKKKREEWILGRYKISLDTIKGLGEFVEIELRNEKDLKKCLKFFEITTKELIEETYPELIREKLKRKKE